jgi:hypothetical protein
MSGLPANQWEESRNRAHHPRRPTGPARLGSGALGFLNNIDGGLANCSPQNENNVRRRKRRGMLSCRKRKTELATSKNRPQHPNSAPIVAVRGAEEARPAAANLKWKPNRYIHNAPQYKLWCSWWIPSSVHYKRSWELMQVLPCSICMYSVLERLQSTGKVAAPPARYRRAV